MMLGELLYDRAKPATSEAALQQLHSLNCSDHSYVGKAPVPDAIYCGDSDFDYSYDSLTHEPCQPPRLARKIFRGSRFEVIAGVWRRQMSRRVLQANDLDEYAAIGNG
jgi:hypothetical protein